MFEAQLTTQSISFRLPRGGASSSLAVPSCTVGVLLVFEMVSSLISVMLRDVEESGVKDAVARARDCFAFITGLLDRYYVQRGKRLSVKDGPVTVACSELKNDLIDGFEKDDIQRHSNAIITAYPQL